MLSPSLMHHTPPACGREGGTNAIKLCDTLPPTHTHTHTHTGTWTVDTLSGVLEAQPSVIRRHLGFWVGQGVLREHPTDTFTVVEEEQEGARGTGGDACTS